MVLLTRPDEAFFTGIADKVVTLLLDKTNRKRFTEQCNAYAKLFAEHHEARGKYPPPAKPLPRIVWDDPFDPEPPLDFAQRLPHDYYRLAVIHNLFRRDVQPIPSKDWHPLMTMWLQGQDCERHLESHDGFSKEKIERALQFVEADLRQLADSMVRNGKHTDTNAQVGSTVNVNITNNKGPLAISATGNASVQQQSVYDKNRNPVEGSWKVVMRHMLSWYGILIETLGVLLAWYGLHRQYPNTWFFWMK